MKFLAQQTAKYGSVALLSLLLFSGTGDFAAAQVTVQKRDRSTPKTEPSDSEEYDNWGRRRTNAKTRRVLRRFEDDGPNFAPPVKLVEMTFRVSPMLSMNTTEGTGAYNGFISNGAGLRLSVGPTLDYYFFKDRYAFSSGLWYSIKRSSYKIPGQFGQDRFTPGLAQRESVYNLQYVQIPLSVKMYANNLFDHSRVYIQCGGILDVKLAEKPLNENLNKLYEFAMQSGEYRRQYGRGDFGLLLGAGLQYRLNGSQALVVGVNYQRGLIDVARARELTARSRIVALEVGLKF